ncbi:hypothetical protein [Streptomyces blastmyceticus]|uniref:Uncharacterized protein n=1 Tax=Streptomyces blastmyceticus TaxID=68180 RepID=A0ABP3GM45_9ACTN
MPKRIGAPPAPASSSRPAEWTGRTASPPPRRSRSPGATRDWKNTGAHATLDCLLGPGHTEQYQGEAIDWFSLSLWLAATGSRLTLAELAEDVPGLGHSTRHAAAVIQEDGTILADSADSLIVLRGRLAAWEGAARPGLDGYTPTLVPDMETEVPGWDLRLAR